MQGYSRAGLKCRCGNVVEEAPVIPNSYYLICFTCSKCEPVIGPVLQSDTGALD